MIGDLQLLWSIYWPAVAVAAVAGLAIGLFAFRPLGEGPLPTRKKRRAGLAITAAVVAALVALWHGPIGAGDRLASLLQNQARIRLDHFEMQQVTVATHRAPLSRTLVLAGPADDFQRDEIVRLLNLQAGPAGAYWPGSDRRPATLPLILEAELLAFAGFCLAMILSYLLELRRRNRAEWRW